jgi:hypothetical protein
MPRIQLEDVLLDVDRRCGFTRAFRPLAGYQPHGTDTYRALLGSPADLFKTVGTSYQRSTEKLAVR